MIGAILGDMIGSPYEFDRGNKTKDFPLFCRDSAFTDDTVMTIAVAEALLDAQPKAEDDWIRRRLISCMKKWGAKYPDAGYGTGFMLWLIKEHPKPYNSFGNGSAMRVSAAAWLYNSIDAVRHAARLTAEVTHNHPEGIKGAEATASAIFLARTGHSKAEIKDYVEREFGYDLSRTLDEIRPKYHFDVSCQGSVPEAIIAFYESSDYEDAVRKAVSLGGDSDTIACMAGAVAEAYYGMPENLKAKAMRILDPYCREIVEEFERFSST
jgi:ADP-ribosylglycohydrolase